MTAAVIALVLGAVGLGSSLVFTVRLVRFDLLERIGREKVVGHVRLRRRMCNLAGKGNNKPRYETVVRAETMRGWVWIFCERRNGHGFEERMGWSPFRWTARRALARQGRAK